MAFFRRHWPLFMALTGAIAVLTFMGALILRNTAGHLIYTLDDPYIHLAIARNLAQNGTWGVNASEFASASSSLLWPLILGGLIRIFGNSDLYPLLLNILLALMLIIVSYRVMWQHGLRGVMSLVALTVMFFAGPIPAMVFSGMEHVLQMLAATLFATAAYDVLTAEHPDARVTLRLVLTALLVTTTRYEGLFIVAVACILLVARKRIALAVVIAFVAGLPLALFGLISLWNGGYFLPNGVVLKGFTPTNVAGADTAAYLLRVAGHVGQMLTEAPHLLWIMVMGALILLCNWLRRPDDRRTFAKLSWTLFIPTCLMHVAFASVGWFFRYEAYLVYWGAGLIAITVAPILRENRVTLLHPSQIPFMIGRAALAGTILVLLLRAFYAAAQVPVAATNIYQQQYQMSQFIKEYYSSQAVAINDIGAIGYRSGVTVVDLFGLASLDVMKLRQSHNYTPVNVARLVDASNAGIAVIYDEWFTGGFLMTGLPPGWVRAGSWKIANNVVAGSDTVSFYAVRPQTLPGLVANLRAYSPQLPVAAGQAGMYTERP